MKPAPIQIMWLGYPNTSGSCFMDYIITDEIASPLNNAEQFSERMAYMPQSFFIGDHAQMFPHLKYKLKLRSIVEIPLTAVIASPIDTNNIVNFRPGNKRFSLKKSKPKLNEAVSVKLSESSKTIAISMGLNIYRAFTEIPPDRYQERSGQIVPDFILVTCRSRYGIPDDAIVYCNFNILNKCTPQCMNSWCTIIKAVPKSVLWLLRYPPCAEDHLRKFIINQGIDPNRLIFADFALKEEHVRRSQLADICLDTLVCNGYTTGMDVLWAGTPIVTYPLDHMASRVTASMLMALGCPELIAESLQDYERIAIRLGNDQNQLARIRGKIYEAKTSSSLFNVETYTRNLEKLYKCMFERLRQNKPLDHILSKD
ncbi:hypothetical protein ACOME3_006059 [Neoechinorhynchus agilis]